jgi:hypothetical protein
MKSTACRELDFRTKRISRGRANPGSGVANSHSTPERSELHHLPVVLLVGPFHPRHSAAVHHGAGHGTLRWSAMRSAFGLRELPYAVAFGSGLLLGPFEASEVSRRAAAIACFF